MTDHERTCVCGNVTVIAFPPAYIEEGSFRCWLCPTEQPPKPTLRLVPAPTKESADE